MNVRKLKVMSEVSKKKKKKRHHSSSSNDFEAPSKRIKVEASETADDSPLLSTTCFDCDASVVEHQQKKKHKHHHTAGVDVDVTRGGNTELSWTNSSGQYDATDVVAEPGLKKCSSHKRLKHIKHENSSLHQQNLTNSSHNFDQLCLPELRYT